MTNLWNNELFENFVRLRDALRAAKKEKDYQRVLVIGQSILELDTRATFLKIATPIFQKDMAEACIKLGKFTSAIEYLVVAKAGFIERKNAPDDWQHDIAMIDKKLAKLSACDGKSS